MKNPSHSNFSKISFDVYGVRTQFTQISRNMFPRDFFMDVVHGLDKNNGLAPSVVITKNVFIVNSFQKV